MVGEDKLSNLICCCCCCLLLACVTPGARAGSSWRFPYDDEDEADNWCRPVVQVWSPEYWRYEKSANSTTSADYVFSCWMAAGALVIVVVVASSLLQMAIDQNTHTHNTTNTNTILAGWLAGRARHKHIHKRLDEQPPF